MRLVLKLPKLSMNMAEAALVHWHKREGEQFAAGEILYSIETEKVTSDMEAPCAGLLSKTLVSEGDNVEVGAPVCEIERYD
jgi:pyruvate/2-oxoglutarate dehydrogenase complex dihydrolipoamide acyltransferase (E2) component